VAAAGLSELARGGVAELLRQQEHKVHQEELQMQEEEAQVPYGEMWQGHMDTIWELMTREELVDEIKWRREDQLYLEKRIESQKRGVKEEGR
jgi:hypothetical protein